MLWGHRPPGAAMKTLSFPEAGCLGPYVLTCLCNSCSTATGRKASPAPCLQMPLVLHTLVKCHLLRWPPLTPGPPTGVNAHPCFFHSNAPSESGPAHVVFSLLPAPTPRPGPHQAELLGDTTGAVCVIRAYFYVSTVYTEQKEKGRRREEEQRGREGENKT